MRILAIGRLLRRVLVVRVWIDLAGDVSLVGAISTGLMRDPIYAAYSVVPLVILLTLIPQRLFGAVAEWVFWDEFSVRSNFIAVDYLAYMTEVMDNILESYGVVLIVGIASVGHCWRHT